jgi:hypothetical protein
LWSADFKRFKGEIMRNIVAVISMTVMFFTGAVSLVSVTSVPAFAAPPAAATDVDPKGSIQDGINGAGGSSAGSLQDGIKKVVNILLFLLGALAVVVIVIGGIRYTLSNGEQAQIKQAKDTILYAVVGLIVAILAYAIVNFVVGQF